MVGKVRPLEVSHSSRRQHSTCGLGAAMCCASSDQYDSSPRQSLVISACSGSQLVTEREPSHIYTCEKLLHSCDLKEGDNLWTYSAERNSGCFPLLEREVQLDRLGCWALSVALISCPPATSSRSRTEDVAGGDPAGFAASCGGSVCLAPPRHVSLQEDDRKPFKYPSPREARLDQSSCESWQCPGLSLVAEVADYRRMQNQVSDARKAGGGSKNGSATPTRNARKT